MAREFLNVDRVFACAAVLRILYIVWCLPYVFDSICIPGIFGLYFLLVSESASTHNGATHYERKLELALFVISHNIWHKLAFECFSEASYHMHLISLLEK